MCEIYQQPREIAREREREREGERESILEVVVEDALVKSMRGGQKAARLQMRFIVNLLSVPKANIKRAARDTGPSSEAGRSNKDSRKHTHTHTHTAVQTIKANIEYER